MNTVDKVLGFSLQESFFMDKYIYPSKNARNEIPSYEPKKTPNHGLVYKYPQLRYGTNRRHKPSTPPQQPPTNRYENDPTDNDALYDLHRNPPSQTFVPPHRPLRNCRGRSTAHRNIQIRRNRTIHINHLIDRPSNDMSGHASPPGMNSSTSPMNGIVKQNGDTIGRRHQLSRHSDNRSSQHRHRLNKLFVLV